VDDITSKSDAIDRDGLTNALEHLSSADGLLVGKLDRLARQLTVQEAILAMIWRDGRRAFAADQGEVLHDDPDDPMRTAMRQMQGVFAQLDRAMIVKRMRDGRRAKARAGRHAVGQYRYGYEGSGKGRARDAATRVSEQAAVARIVELRAEGESYRAIAATLDAEGHRPRRAATWSAMAVRSVALRELGWVGHGRGVWVAPGPFPVSARRTGRAALTASGSPRVLPVAQLLVAAWVQGVGMFAPR